MYFVADLLSFALQSVYNKHFYLYRDISFCPYCNAVIDYMENLGVHLARKDEGHCRKDDCEISSLTEVINQTCTFEDNTPYEKLCSDMYSATLCANDTVVTKCGDLFGDDYMRRNYTPPNVYPCWHCQQMTKYMSKFNKTVQQRDANKSHDNPLGTTCPLNFTSDCAEKNAQPMIQDCKNKQIPSNLSFFADPAHSKNVCRLADNCAYCTEAINITEKYGGRLKIESDSGPSEYCVRPDCTKRYPCADCTELIEFMGKHDGKVYQADKNNNPVVVRSVNMTCPVGRDECYGCPKSNAKNFVDECKKVFYEATSFGHSNESVGVEYCSALQVMLKCVHDEVKAICGHSETKRYMKSEMYPEVRGDMCEDCIKSVAFMEGFGGHVYIRDLPAGAVCKLNKTIEKTKPVTSAKSYYASGFYVHILSLLYVFMYSVLQVL
ncbi:hypothetical protein DdX_19970 [Ditylenchus destructor]|uniref:Uncharacterized protein n=1 Tax=Ditylenchus destructor TaxID=166010 RepID=A0AAD4MM97_9BILA|nr:hypothetical protein DdX_19970 [Ditylenchus destructor]